MRSSYVELYLRGWVRHECLEVKLPGGDPLVAEIRIGHRDAVALVRQDRAKVSVRLVSAGPDGGWHVFTNGAVRSLWRKRERGEQNPTRIASANASAWLAEKLGGPEHAGIIRNRADQAVRGLVAREPKLRAEGSWNPNRPGVWECELSWDGLGLGTVIYVLGGEDCAFWARSRTYDWVALDRLEPLIRQEVIRISR